MLLVCERGGLVVEWFVCVLCPGKGIRGTNPVAGKASASAIRSDGMLVLSCLSMLGLKSPACF